MDYFRTTNNQGIASTNINLNSGNYSISSYYEGNENYESSSTTNNINIRPTIIGKDIVKNYKNDTQYYATFVNSHGNLLINTQISFNINGVFYQRKTNENGIAKLNINLNPGDYIITATNPINGEMYSNNVKVLPTIFAEDLNMVYRDGSKFTAHVLDDAGRPLVNSNVIFNVNGVFYTRMTDNEGNAHLNINLDVGEYIITASNYKGLSASKKIKINKCYSIINDSNVRSIVGLNRDYSITLSGLNNKTIPLANINFKYDGFSMNAITNENGEATIVISNPSEGKHSIEYEFKGNLNYYPYKSSNTLIVSNTNNIITGKDLRMIYQDGSKFNVTLTDLKSNPIANETITLTIDGKSYVRTTNKMGTVSLGINLKPGTYEISYACSDINSINYNKGTNTILVSKIPTYLSANDLIFDYGESKSFTAMLSDARKNPLENIDVTFTISGVSYKRSTNASGVAKLNINLPVGYYDITTSLDNAFYTASSKSNHILVNGTVLISQDLSLIANLNRDYSVRLLDAYKNPIANAPIEFSYNGISKNANTDSNGVATITVGNLPKGEFTIVYKYIGGNNEGQSNIHVSQSVLNSKNTISNLSPYLSYSNNCQVSNTEIIKLAEQLTKGLTKPLDKAMAIYNYVRDEISYSYYYDTKYGAVETLHHKTGNCVDQSHLSIALYRAAGLPARYVHGTCAFNDGDTGGHVWTQVLIDGIWVVSDSINRRNSLGEVVNWNNNNYKLQGYYSSLYF